MLSSETAKQRLRRAQHAPLTLLACVGFAACKETPKPPPEQPPSVVVEPVEVRDAPVVTEVTGEVRGGEDVEVRARIAGYLQSINYKEGALVREGDLLFVIDPKPFEANVARARADLEKAQAAHDRAVVQVNRLRPLVAQNAVSQQDLDNAVAMEETGRASIAAAQAQLTSARLDLGYTQVTSPISGLAGIRQVDVGTYVGSPQPTVLAVVSKLDPVRFDFNISETEYLELARSSRARGQVQPQVNAPLTLKLADGSTYPYKGRLTVVGRGVSTETGTLPMQATFPNPNGLLRPGQFARLSLPITTRRNAIVIPQRAVEELQGTYNVFVVGADNVVQSREVKLANRIASDWVVTDGLEPTDRIIVEGLQKVRVGAKVRPTAANLAKQDTATSR